MTPPLEEAREHHRYLVELHDECMIEFHRLRDVIQRRHGEQLSRASLSKAELLCLKRASRDLFDAQRRLESQRETVKEALIGDVA